MNTNTVPYIDELIKWSNSLDGLPAGALVFILCITAGYIWKSIHVLENRFIPLVVILTGAAIMLLLTWVAGESVPVRARNAVIGVIIGFAAWMAHMLIIKRISAKLGLGENDDDNKPTPP